MSKPQPAPDPALRRGQLYFLSAGLDFVLPHVEEIQRLAEAVGIPWAGLPGQLALDQLRRLREDVTRAIFLTEEVGRST